MQGLIMMPNLEKSRFFYAGMLLFGVFISSISQVLLKKAAQRHYDSWIKEYLNVPVFFAYFLFFGTTLLSIYAYKGIPLSWGPILESTGYFYVTIFGIKFFHETINRKKVFALLLIFCGIAVYALFG